MTLSQESWTRAHDLVRDHLGLEIPHHRRADLEDDMEVSVRVGGREIVLNADKQQMVELLFSTSEELSESNRRLEEARLELEEQARELERRVAERTRELGAAEARYRTLVEHIPAIVSTAAVDEVGRITTSARRSRRCAGTPPRRSWLTGSG